MADVTDDPPDVLKTRQQWADDLLASDLVKATVDLDDRFKELEERIRQLEARPYPIVQPYLVPSWPSGLWIVGLPRVGLCPSLRRGLIPPALPEDHAPGALAAAGVLRGVGRQPAAFRAAGAGVASFHHAVWTDEYHTGYG